MTTETIRPDVSSENHLNTEADAAEAFLRKWRDPDSSSKKTSEAVVEEAEDDGSDETADHDQDDKIESNEEAEEAEESEEDPADAEAEDDDDNEEVSEAKVADDDAIVKFTVDGKEEQVSVKELKRLAGQEKALTQKSQAVAAATKKANDLAAVHDTALKAIYDKAAAKFKPYAEIDYLVAQTTMSKEDFAQLRADAKAAADDFKFFESELKSTVEKRNAQAQADTAEAAKACLEAITNPEHPAHIPNWSTEVYNGIRSYAVSLGVPQEAIDGLTDPISISILEKARRYDAGKKVLTKKKAAAAPVKVLNNKKTNKSSAKPVAEAAMGKLRKSGSTADAAAAFLARWAD